MTRTPQDGAFYASGAFVCRRPHVKQEGTHETVLNNAYTVCEVDKSAGKRAETAQQIASALNAQMRLGG
ncbi:hypothetical protein [Roseobacter sp. S98]|uniref:hypothetical protein n=1 Tax=Roseobacter algicola (ex Choi et al. 2025) (nom. illeg.) TaxID=3092138 RepID=UPI0035C6C556